MIRALNLLLFLLNVAMLFAATYFVVSRGYVTGATGWSPVELVTTVLTALSILITVLGIFIAVIAVWGYARLSEEARNVAATVAREHVGREAAKAITNEVQRQIGSSGYGRAAAGENVDSPT